MPKTKISEFSATPANNTDIDSINLAEGMAPSLVNDAIRELMSQLKDFQTGAVGDSFNGPINGTLGATTPATASVTTLAASGAVTLSGGTANGVTYLNGSKVLTSGSALVFDGTNLGVGTATTATWKLNVAQNTPYVATMYQSGGISHGNKTAVLAFYDGTYYNSVAYWAHTHAWTINGGGTQAMTLDASGNLGIGTTSASGILHVNGVQDGTAGKNARFSYSGTYYLEINEQAIRSFNNPLIFGSGTSGAERARILSSGEFLVSATSSFGVGVTIYTPDSGGSYSNATSTASRNHWRFANANGAVGSIQTSGSATSYNTSSDYRLKNTIAPMTGALAKVALLKPCTYKWNSDNSNGEGFIAHELAEVVPQCVTGEKDAVDAEGKPQYQGIDTSFLVATLTAALQEAVAEINSLKARLDAANL